MTKPLNNSENKQIQNIELTKQDILDIEQGISKEEVLKQLKEVEKSLQDGTSRYTFNEIKAELGIK